MLVHSEFIIFQSCTVGWSRVIENQFIWWYLVYLSERTSILSRSLKEMASGLSAELSKLEQPPIIFWRHFHVIILTGYEAKVKSQFSCCFEHLLVPISFRTLIIIMSIQSTTHLLTNHKILTYVCKFFYGPFWSVSDKFS